MRYDVGSRATAEKVSDLGHILRMGATEFSNGLTVECERKGIQEWFQRFELSSFVEKYLR